MRAPGLLVLALLAGTAPGCRVIPYDAPTQLLIDDAQLEPYRGLVMDGAAYWRAVGIAIGDDVDAPAATVRVVIGTEPVGACAHAVGCWRGDTGVLELRPEAFATVGDNGVRETVAHELGHALGLSHVDGLCSAVMNPQTCGLDRLYYMDKLELLRVHPDAARLFTLTPPSP